ncbi:MAG: lectin like domain-containing protein [bacterium]|nr:lectin like domain-containing protein [bacterium]
MQKKSLMILVAVMIVGVAVFSFAQEQLKPTRAPVNPEFIQYLEAVKSNKVSFVTADGLGLGHIPSPKLPPPMKGLKVIQSDNFVAPSFYDLRSTGKVTGVRNQGGAGSCWAHAGLGSLESCLLPSETWDFSEMNVKNLLSSSYPDGYDRTHLDGGNHYMVTAYLSRWTGPILESDDPYIWNVGTSPTNKPIQKHITDVDWIPARASSTDNDNIKNAIMNYGGVYATYYHYSGTAYYNSTTYAYYSPSGSSTNHAIMLVGWDDNFPASKFNTTPPGNGAFIVKNSWGTSWGQSGYFYISYYDSALAKTDYSAQFRYANPTTDYNKVYQYDPLGNVTDYGFGTNYAWGANIFTATAADKLAAVSFYALMPNTGYEIYIYDNVTPGAPQSGTLVNTKTGTCTMAGYHIISLDSTYSLTSGQRFSVVVRFYTPAYNYPIPCEIPYTGYSSQASANPGESFIRSSGGSWQDISASDDANVCVKVFTQPTIHITGTDNWQLYQ